MADKVEVFVSGAGRGKTHDIIQEVYESVYVKGDGKKYLVCSPSKGLASQSYENLAQLIKTSREIRPREKIETSDWPTIDFGSWNSFDAYLILSPDNEGGKKTERSKYDPLVEVVKSVRLD